MHLRGKRFEDNLVAGRKTETLLRVNYDFFWQRSYRLAGPPGVKGGTGVWAGRWDDQSKKTSTEPEPERPATSGEQTLRGMMARVVDVAVAEEMGKEEFFRRR